MKNFLIISLCLICLQGCIGTQKHIQENDGAEPSIRVEQTPQSSPYANIQE